MLEEKFYQLTLSNINFKVKFQHPLTLLQYFSDFCRLGEDMNARETISVSSEEINKRKEDFGSESFTEFNLLLEHFCNRFLLYKRCLFHSVAICVDDQAFLITAPSGTDKSTQYCNLKTLFGEKIRLISGDKPIFRIPVLSSFTHPLGGARSTGGAVVRQNWQGLFIWNRDCIMRSVLCLFRMLWCLCTPSFCISRRQRHS